MKYYKIDWTTDSKKYAFVEGMAVSERLRKLYDRGIYLEQEEITLKLVNLVGDFPDMLVGGPVSPIVSKDFVALLTETVDSSEFQAFDVDVSNRSTVPEYSFLNILNNQDAVDETRSQLTRLPSDIFPDQQDVIRSAESLVLDEDRLGTRRIFRLSKMRQAVYVRNDLKLAIEATCSKGVRFNELP